MGYLTDSDIFILFFTKILRMFAFGAISVIFIQSLISKGIEEKKIGFLQSSIALGDIFVSLILTTRADKIGRKRILILSALLKVFAGITYAFSDNYGLLVISGIFGVLTVSGGQIGPFLPIQQAAITQIIQNKTASEQQMGKYTAKAFGYYNMFSYLSQALGNLSAGFYINYMNENQMGQLYSDILLGYAVFGFCKVICYCCLSSDIEPRPEKQVAKKIVNCAGLTSNSTKIIAMLCLLFFIDSFAGGFVAQSFLSLYYEKKYSLQFSSIGGMLAICNIVGGISGLVSSVLVAKIGAIATMIFTHLPSNILLILISLTSNKTVAVTLLMFRFCISQMDVPARQTYVSMVVSSSERSAANGITNIVRTVGVAISLPIAGFLWSAPAETFMFSFPFLLAGLLKSFYDITLGFCFLKEKCMKSKEENMNQNQLYESNMASGTDIEMENQQQGIEVDDERQQPESMTED